MTDQRVFDWLTPSRISQATYESRLNVTRVSAHRIGWVLELKPISLNDNITTLHLNLVIRHTPAVSVV